MITLEEQLRAFAKAHGGTYRVGPQAPKPAPSIVSRQGLPRPSENPQPKTMADPYIEYTEDYSLWCRTHRGE